ncbi:hypothetical protein H5410_051153, partial [Solanum commersonii]
MQPKKTIRNHQSLKCLLQLVQRRERIFRPILKLNFRIAKIPVKQHISDNNAQAIKGQNLPHCFGSTPDPILQ